jgi:hypothetical protein
LQSTSIACLPCVVLDATKLIVILYIMLFLLCDPRAQVEYKLAQEDTTAALTQALAAWQYPDNMYISAISGTVVMLSKTATHSKSMNSSSSGYAAVVEAARTSADITQYNSNNSAANTSIVVHGRNLDATALQSLFSIAITSTATAAARKPQRALRDRSSVTLAEIDRICNEHALDALPKNWSYDGQFYIDYRGAQLERRPDTEQLIEQYLAVQNSSITAYNAAL